MPYKIDPVPRPRAEFLCDTAGSILSIRIRGEIDHHTSSAIRTGIDATLFERRPKKLILDLSAVSFMDSSGLGLIMGRYSVMKELEGEMTVWNPSPETSGILRLAGMDRLVRIEYPQGKDPKEAFVHEGGVKASDCRSSLGEHATEGVPRTSTRKRRKKSIAPKQAPRKEKNA